MAQIGMKDKKDLARAGRGTIDVASHEELRVNIISWQDNCPVTLLTSFSSAEPWVRSAALTEKKNCMLMLQAPKQYLNTLNL